MGVEMRGQHPIPFRACSWDQVGRIVLPKFYLLGTHSFIPSSESHISCQRRIELRHSKYDREGANAESTSSMSK